MSTKHACARTDSNRPATSTKRLRACNETTIPALPVDLLLEIAARSDFVTIVRCAATSRPLRGAILDEGFRRRLALRTAAHGGFDPALLRGISYLLEDSDVADRPVRVVQALPSPEPLLGRFDASPGFEPVASRDGLVVLRRGEPPHVGAECELRVCDSLTGHTLYLPPMSVRDYYPQALLAVDDGGRSFELLAADRNLRAQTYSSRDGKWSAARAAHLVPPRNPPSIPPLPHSHTMVIGRTVHWLCLPRPCQDLRSAQELDIVALDVGAARATVIELPRGCVSRMTATKRIEAITLAVSADGRLSLVVSETQAISMWTLSDSTEGEPRWSRRVLMDKQDWGVHHSVRFHGFGERSGTVLFYMSSVGLVQLNLATKSARVVLHTSDPYTTHVSHVCLHEINLASLLQAMKPLS